MVWKILTRSKRRNKGRRRALKPRSRQNIVSKTITDVRKISKPQTLLLPGLLKHKYNQVTGLHPKKRLGFEIAKRRNRRLNSIRDNLKNSLHTFTKNMIESRLTDEQRRERYAQRICVERRLRRDEIMRKTHGKGLKVKNAIWTPESRLVRCEKDKVKRRR